MMPPLSVLTGVPGLLMSKLRATRSLGGFAGSRCGVGIRSSTAWMSASRFTFCCAETGMTGAPSATLPLRKAWICAWFCCACSWLTRSTLFWTTTMFLIPEISSTVRCSRVCGCGQGSFAPITKRAPSITAAPASMVVIRVSCPGASTTEIVRSRSPAAPHVGHAGAVLYAPVPAHWPHL